MTLKTFLLLTLWVICIQTKAQTVRSVNGRSGYVTLTKSDVNLNKVDNTADISKPISNAVLNALNGKQDKLVAGNNILINGNTISVLNSNAIINLPEQTWRREFRPADYLTTYDDGSQQGAFFANGYATFPGVNNSNRPNVVYQIAAYNSTITGPRMLTTDGAWSQRVETHYDIPGMGSSFEPHLFLMTDKFGTAHRNLSGYFPKDGTPGFWKMEGWLNLYEPIKGIPGGKQFASLSAGQLTLSSTGVGRGAGIFLNHHDGTQMKLSIISGVPEFLMPAAPDFGQGRFYVGYGQVQEGLKNFNNDVEAIAGGLQVGSHYFRTIVINGEPIEVETRVKEIVYVNKPVENNDTVKQ